MLIVDDDPLVLQALETTVSSVGYEAVATENPLAGLKILEERVLPDGRRVCFFEDPEGVRLEFLEWKH